MPSGYPLDEETYDLVKLLAEEGGLSGNSITAAVDVGRWTVTRILQTKNYQEYEEKFHTFKARARRARKIAESGIKPEKKEICLDELLKVDL